MPIFGDPQSFLKQASSRNNDMSALTNDNQQTSMNSSATSQAQTNLGDGLGDQTSDNKQLTDGMNKDMSTGPGTMQDKSGIQNSSKLDVDGTQKYQELGADGETITTTSFEREEQSGMADWIKKKVMGGTEQEAPTKEAGTIETGKNPTTDIPEGTNADLQYIEPNNPKMPKAPEPPPHRSNVPKGADIKNLPKSNMPKVGRAPKASLPNFKMPKMPRLR